MNRFILLLSIGIFMCRAVQAQQFDVCMQVVASSGGQGIQSNNLYTWTIGESFTSTLNGSAYIFTQGFEQPESCGKNTVGTNDLSDWGIDVFPNPSSDWFNIRYSPEQQGVLSASVFDLLGRPLLLHQALESSSGSLIDASAWPPGIYLLLLQDPVSKSFATYRITRI